MRAFLCVFVRLINEVNDHAHVVVTVRRDKIHTILHQLLVLLPRFPTGNRRFLGIWSCMVDDSWFNNAYDGNKYQCLHVNHASSVQLKNDNTWYDNQHIPYLEFKACSGSRLDAMRPQMDSCGSPRFTVMTCGGNNASVCLLLNNPTKGHRRPPLMQKILCANLHSTNSLTLRQSVSTSKIHKTMAWNSKTITT